MTSKCGNFSWLVKPCYQLVSSFILISLIVLLIFLLMKCY